MAHPRNPGRIEASLPKASAPRFSWTNSSVYSAVLAVCNQCNFPAARTPVSSKCTTAACCSWLRTSASTDAANSYPSTSPHSTVSLFKPYPYRSLNRVLICANGILWSTDSFTTSACTPGLYCTTLSTPAG